MNRRGFIGRTAAAIAAMCGLKRASAGGLDISKVVDPTEALARIQAACRKVAPLRRDELYKTDGWMLTAGISKVSPSRRIRVYADCDSVVDTKDGLRYPCAILDVILNGLRWDCLEGSLRDFLEIAKQEYRLVGLLEPCDDPAQYLLVDQHLLPVNVIPVKAHKK